MSIVTFFKNKKSQDIFSHFDHAIKWIENALSDPRNKVYIHCMEGRSRSATIVAAYLMHKLGINADEAIKMIQAKRAIANPNIGFCNQLLQFYNLKIRTRKVSLSAPDLLLPEGIPANPFEQEENITIKRIKLKKIYFFEIKFQFQFFTI